MSGVTGAVVGSSILGAGAQAYGANKAAKAQGKAADASIAEQRRQFDLIRQDNAPYQQTGVNALNALAGVSGLGGTGGPDYSAFYKSPDYNFALQQGQQAIERSAAARGGLASGNTLAALTQYGQGLASQNFNTYANRLAGLAGVGQTANNAVGQAGLQTSGNISDSLIAQGNARASGVAGMTNAFTDLIGTIGGVYGQRKKPNSLSSGGYRYTVPY